MGDDRKEALENVSQNVLSEADRRGHGARSRAAGFGGLLGGLLGSFFGIAGAAAGGAVGAGVGAAVGEQLDKARTEGNSETR